MKKYTCSTLLILSIALVLPASAADLLDFVWSGGISDTAAVVVSKTKDHSGTNQCKLVVYSDAGFTTNVFQSLEPVVATTNNNSVVKMTASTGLVANTTYFYRIEVNGVEDDTKTGRFTTCPTGDGGNFKIAFANSNDEPNSPVYSWIKTYAPLFFINSGDFHYEDINDTNEVLALTRQQTAYEKNLNVTGLGASQAELYRNVAFGYMWDDHDFGPNDCHAKGSIATRRTEPEAQSAAHSIYRQYIPHWPISLESNTNFPAGKAPIAQAFTIGRVRFILCDIRSQSEQNGSAATNATLLGAEQKTWFKEELLKASGTYPLIVWLTTTPWNGAQEPVAGNKWFQHTGERAEISNFLKNNHIRGFSAIGGDAHMVAIDDGSYTDFAMGGGAGFPLIHAASIGSRTSYKGGPYSEGAKAAAHQYGAMEFEDRTNELVSTFVCLNGPSSVSNIIVATADNIGNPLKYVFTNSWPLITSLSPADDETNVLNSTDLVVTFNETIQTGTGNLNIHRLSDDVIEQTIAVTSVLVTVSGTQLTIDLPDTLRDETAYYVTLDEGVVTDGTSDFPGIYAADGVDYKKWNFSTKRVAENYTLPFSDDFETYTPGSISGWRGWTGNGTVQTGTVYAGSQACELGIQPLAHIFDDHPEQILITFYAKPTAGEVNPALIPADATAVFYVNSNNQVVAYSNQTSVELATSILSNDWNFFEVSSDYTSDTWSLSVNGTNALQNFPFYTAATSFVGVSFAEGSATSHLDNVSISVPDADSDGDTLPDWWETQYYGGATNANPGDLSSNGVNTVGQAYIAGLNPTNPASLFIVTSLQPGVSNHVNWQSVSGRTYTVYWTSNLLSPFGSPIGSNLSWPAASFTDTQHQGNAAGFYKLEVELSNP